MELLPLFGCTANNRGDYIFLDANTPEEITRIESAANEFRQFYDELKRIKNGNVDIVDYFLYVSNREKYYNLIILFRIYFSIQSMVFFKPQFPLL